MAKALAVFSITWDGIPLIYSGQELPLRTKRLEFFEKDPIPWNGTYEMAAFYKKLLTLKSNNPALRGADDNVVTILIQNTAPDKVFSYLRKNGDDEVLVILNMSREAELNFSLTDSYVSGIFRSLFSDVEHDFTGQTAFTLQPFEYMVFEK
jgi:glycosidase